MAGTQKTSQFTAATVANPTDEVPLLQGGVLKRVQVKTLVGNPDVGWLATGESWTFSSFSSATRIGIVTVPSDATTKYVAGNRIKIAQTTGGTKYGIIHAVASTTLSIFFPVGITLNNEAINTPFYSPLYSPNGFNASSDNWSLESVVTSDSTQSSPTFGTWYNLGSHSLQVGVGTWKLYGKNSHGADRASAGRTDNSHTISTSSSSESNKRYTSGVAGSNTTFSAGTAVVSEDIVLASPVTLYSLVALTGGSTGASNLFMFGTGGTIGGSRIIKVTSAYV